MKKVLSTVLALGLVAGVASTAAAAYDSFSVSGYYQVEGTYASNVVRADGVDLSGADDFSSAWYYHKARLYPNLKVNDKVTVKSEIRLLHDDWGAGTGSDAAGNDVVDWDKLYMIYNSPIGTMHIGTTTWGSWGTSFGDSASRMNAIKYFPPVPAPFTSVVFTGKISEADSNMQASDQDYDYSEGRFGFKNDTVKTEMGLGWFDNGAAQTDAYRLRGYAVANMGAVAIEGEFDHKWGDASTTTDFDTWAAYGQVSGKAGNLGWGVLAWYTSGEDTDVDTSAYGTGGNDFEPLMIATGDDFGVLQDDLGSNNSFYRGVARNAGQIAFGAWASMPVSNKLTLTTVVGTAYADEEPMNAAGTAKADDHYGYEIDLKADYKLLDNLTYSMNFGYLDAGDLIKDIGAPQDQVIVLNNTLNMQF